MGILSRLAVSYRRHTAKPFIPPGMTFFCLPMDIAPPFVHGLEICNDDSTPMTFVVDSLTTILGLTFSDATAATALTHTYGGVLIPTLDRATAEQYALQLTTHAAAHGWPLQCRAVSVSPEALQDTHE